MSDNKSDHGKLQPVHLLDSMPNIMAIKNTQMNAGKAPPPLPAQAVSRPLQTKSETSTPSDKNS